ncbi:hypothetical protein [Mycoplasma capricolum]|uniref:hypothetical protein n=1 Tax=Mycoplasma capricolum TaxID=2095 RepID=UPI0014055DA0|nr:hypothetical protein [Mycoplasma capricolum]
MQNWNNELKDFLAQQEKKKIDLETEISNNKKIISELNSQLANLKKKSQWN